MSCIIAAGAGYCLARCMEQGLADAMGLNTLRHGTDPATWLKVHFNGAKPDYDRSCLAEPIHHEGPKRFTFSNECNSYGVDFRPLWKAFNEKYDISRQTSVLQDKVFVYIPEAAQQVIGTVCFYIIYARAVSYMTNVVREAVPLMSFLYSTGPIQIIMKRVMMHSVPMIQKTIASYRFVRVNWPTSSKLTALFQLTIVPFMALITPTIKFYLHPNQMDDRFVDPLIGRVILYTEQDVSPLHIGLTGIFNNSLRSFWPPILRAPLQVSKGVCVIVAGGAVAYAALTFAPVFFATHQVAIATGILLAVF